MITIRLLLMILAIICLLLAAIGVATPRLNLMAAGLCLWAIASIVSV
jgi:hypothetical protein